MITSEKDLCLKDLSLAPRRWLVAMFCLSLVAMGMNLLVLKQAWEYKSKWIDLQARVEKLESLFSVPVGITKQKP